MKRFRGGLVFKAHRLLYHSTLGSRVIKKKKQVDRVAVACRGDVGAAKVENRAVVALHLVLCSGFEVLGFGGSGVGLMGKGVGFRDSTLTPPHTQAHHASDSARVFQVDGVRFRVQVSGTGAHRGKEPSRVWGSGAEF